MADPLTAASGASSGTTPRESFALRWRYATAGVLFTLAYRVFGLRRGTIRRNLERSFPASNGNARAEIRREFVRRQAEVFAEIDYGRRITADELRARVQVNDPSGLLAKAAAPRPLVLPAAHQCNFEWLLLRMSLELGSDLLALYKPLRNPRAERYFHGVRTRFGSKLVPAKSVLRELARFRAARGIGLVADQVPRSSPEKHWTTFLHQPTAFYMGPELLGRALRSQVVYVSMRRLGRGRYTLELQPLSEPGEKTATGVITDRYAAALQRDIEADPAGWWWSHKRWKLKPPEKEAVSP